MTRSSHRNAFTLVELVVVMGIIVLLVGLTLAVSTNVVEKSEIRQTESALKLLDVAVQEWEVAADRKVSFGVAGSRRDIESNWPHVFVLPGLLHTVGRNPAAKAIIAKIDPDLMYRFDTALDEPAWLGIPGDPDPFEGDASSIYSAGELAGRPITGMVTLLDAWGTPVRVIHPGWVFETGDSGDRDDDGTIFVDTDNYAAGYEELYGRALSRRICFVSAGPDRRFGDLTQDTGSNEFEDSQDNIYSYEVEKR